MSNQNNIQKMQFHKDDRNNSGKNFDLIRGWAENKGIYSKGDLKTQSLKLYEEAGELAKAVLNNDEKEVIDAIGDCVVVLTNVAEFARMHFQPKGVGLNGMHIDIENCIGAAYDTISSRKGRMENGTFVKEKELNLDIEINTVKDVYSFMIHLHDCDKLFHPYGCASKMLDEDCNNLFNKDQVEKVDELIEKCRIICIKKMVDIYEIYNNIIQ